MAPRLRLVPGSGDGATRDTAGARRAAGTPRRIGSGATTARRMEHEVDASTPRGIGSRRPGSGGTASATD